MTGLKVQGLLVILGAILVGAAGGVMLERARDGVSAAPRRADGQRPPRERFGPGGRGRLPGAFEDLQLTQEQRNRIDSIFQAWQPRTDAVMNEFLPRVRALRDSVRIAVDSVLTPEQLEELRETMPSFGRDGINPFRGRRGGGGPGRQPPDR